MNFDRTNVSPPEISLPEMLSELTEQAGGNGHASAIKLSESGLLLFTSDDPDHWALQQPCAGELKPVVEHQIVHLEDDRLIAESRKAKSRVPRMVQCFRWEIILSPMVVPILAAAVALLGLGGFGIYAEITTAIEIVRESSLFETPAMDPRLPPIEPRTLVAISFAFAPIFGFLLAIEFVFRLIKEPRNIAAMILAAVSLVLSLTATLAFSYIFGGGGTDGNEFALAFESTSPPWQGYALNMVVMALMNAMVIQFLLQLIKYCFQDAPAKTRLCKELNYELDHILNCIKTTTQTLAILNAVIAKGDLRRERQSLQAKLSSLDN